jgi:hypothetical protein
MSITNTKLKITVLPTTPPIHMIPGSVNHRDWIAQGCPNADSMYRTQDEMLKRKRELRKLCLLKD